MSNPTTLKLSLSQVTPQETCDLTDARVQLSEARRQQDEAEVMLNQQRSALDSKGAKVSALRESVEAGDLDAAMVEPGEYREHQAMAQQFSDLQRAVTARRQAVRSAELKVILAEAVAGIGRMADDEEQARFSAEIAHQIKQLILPALRQAQESDRHIISATDRIKAHEREWRSWAAAERGRGKHDDWASLSLNGSGYSANGFNYRGQRFHGSAEFTLEQAFKRAWTLAVADLKQEKEEAREQGQQG